MEVMNIFLTKCHEIFYAEKVPIMSKIARDRRVRFYTAL